MSRWNDEYKSLSIHDTIKDLCNAIETVPDEICEESVSEFVRITKFLTNLERILNEIDPEVVSFSSLNNLDNTIRNSGLLNQLTNFNNSKNFDELRIANQIIDQQILSYAEPLLLSRTATSANKKEDILDDIVTKFAKNVESKLDNITIRHKEQIDRIDNLNSKEKELRGSIEATIEKINEMNRNWQENCDNVQNEQSKNFNSWMENVKDIIEEKHKNILELHDIVSNDAVSAGYLKDGITERNQANLWRKFSIGFILVAFFWLFGIFLLSIFEGDDSKYPWKTMLYASPVTFILIAGATYTARQSKYH